MSEIFKITCPSCKKSFDAGSAFNSHFEKTKSDNDKFLKDAEIKAELDAAKKYKSQIENSEKEIEKVKKDAEIKAELDAAKKYKSQIENSEKEIEKVKKDAEIKANHRAKKIADEEFKELERTKDAEILQIKKSQEITNDRQKKRLDEMTSLMKNKNVELQGEVQEENLQDFLQKKFPDDDLEEIKKGERGGDCILTINYKDKKNIAKIYFESKDTSNFNEKWADKLLNDMKDKGIANGIIVASHTCLPTDIDKYTSYVERHGNSITIIPMEFKIIHVVVHRIRSILILKARENNDHEIPEVMKKCWANLNSPSFQLPIKSMISEIRTMEKIFKQERTAFERMSANKEKTINGVKTNLVQIVTSFTRTVGDIFPDDLLEHKDDQFIE